MIRLSALALAAGLVSAPLLAHAADQVTGQWNYQLGAAAPCNVTLKAGSSDRSGDADAAANCPGGLASFARWKTTGSNLQLLSPSGSLVAILHEKDGVYSGKQIGGGRSMTLSRATATETAAKQ